MISTNTIIAAGLLSALLFSQSANANADSSPGPLFSYQPPLDPEFVSLMHEADLAKGEKLFMRKCSSCHDNEKQGGHGKGPHLWNVMGRKAGTIAGFEFSDAMRGSGHTWTYATLDYYLTRTDRAVPGLAMEFRGLRRVKDRAALIAFLRLQNDMPPPLP